MPWLHRPFNPHDNPRAIVAQFYPELRDLLRDGREARAARLGAG